MKFLILILCYVTFYSTNAYHYIPLNRLEYRNKNLCLNCIRGPISLNNNYSIFGEQLKNIYIKNDGKVYNQNPNEKNSSFISIFHNKNQTENKCLLYYDEILSSQFKLKWASKFINNIKDFKNFNAKWAFSIYWDRVAEKNNSQRFSYQIIFVSNGKFNFIIFNFIQFYDLKQFQIEFDTKNLKKIFNKTFIDKNGIFVIKVDEKLSNSAKKLKNISFLSIFFYFYFK